MATFVTNADDLFRVFACRELMCDVSPASAEEVGALLHLGKAEFISEEGGQRLAGALGVRVPRGHPPESIRVEDEFLVVYWNKEGQTSAPHFSRISILTVHDLQK